MILKHKYSVLILLMGISILTVFTHCKKDKSEKAAQNKIVLLSGNNQTAMVGEKLANSIVIVVNDQFDKPFKDAVVYFSTNDGTLSSESVTTDAEGNASVSWTLGSKEGEQVLTVKAFKADETTPLSGSPLQVKAIGSPEPAKATSIELVSGNEQTAEEETVLPEPVKVLIKDQYGNPFEGATVTFEVTEGEVSETSVSTNSEGIAQVSWTLGTTIGTQTLLAKAMLADEKTALKGSPVSITATATEKPKAAVIEILSGNGQSAIEKTALANPIEFVIKDQYGDLFEGATVYFSVTEGAVSASSAISDSNGKASVVWTLGTTIGIQNLTVTAFEEDGTTPLNGSPLNVSATATETPVATSFELLSGNGQTGEIEKPLPNLVQVLVKDQFENPLEGVKVNFAVTVGSLSNENITTNSEGKAETEWTLGSNQGTQNLTVYVYKEDGVTQLPGSPIELSATAVGLIDYDGNIYEIVTIGNQVWMAENLKVTHYADGTAIPHRMYDWASLGDNNTDKAYCWVDYKTNSVYGALYTWAAAMNGQNSSSSSPSNVQGACPTGWHLPSDAEWTTLVNEVGSAPAAKLAGNASLWKNGALESNANFGTTGFNALPAGLRNYSNNYFIYETEAAIFWSATQQTSTEVFVRQIYCQSGTVTRKYLFEYKSSGKSVRCVKD